MATAIGHFCSVLAISCMTRNSFLNHSIFFYSSLLLSQPTSPMVSSPQFTCQQTFHPCHSHLIRIRRLSRKRGGDLDKKKHRKRKRKGSKKKKLFKVIRPVSAAGTGFFYAKKKSRKTDKLELKKYDPKVKNHVVFKEVK